MKGLVNQTEKKLLMLEFTAIYFHGDKNTREELRDNGNIIQNSVNKNTELYVLKQKAVLT